jgi:hypothetical protein
MNRGINPRMPHMAHRPTLAFFLIALLVARAVAL